MIQRIRPAWVLATVLPFLAPQAAEDTRHFISTGVFSLDLPADWRQMTPAESVALWKRGVVPEDMSLTHPTTLFSLGAVDRWSSVGFDGIALQTRIEESEPAMNSAAAMSIARHWNEGAQEFGFEYQAEVPAVVAIGPEEHPALQGLRTARSPDGKEWKALDTYVPSGGRTVILSFRAPADRFAQWEARFRNFLSTARFARRPRGAVDLKDRLLWPLAVGALVGIGLLVLRKMARKAH